MHYKLCFQIFVDNWSPTGYDLLNVLSAIVFVCVEKLCGTCILMCCISVELKAGKSIPNHKERRNHRHWTARWCQLVAAR
jgi:hypothetical protein